MPIKLPEKSTSRDDDGNILKRRLLGAAVLIALAVIFLPLLLDGSGSESRFRRVEQLRVEPPRILDRQGKPEIQPDRPSAAPSSQDGESSVARQASVTKPAEIKDMTTSDTQNPESSQMTDQEAANIPVPVPVPVPKTATDEIKNNVAWIVQAASFSDETNAMALRDELRAAQFPTFVSTGTDSTRQPVFRVKVGPITDHEQAVKVQQKVEGILNLKTLIRKYP